MPLFWLSLAYLSGILAAPLFPFPAATWVILAGLSAALAGLGKLILHLRPDFNPRFLEPPDFPYWLSARLPGWVLICTIFLGAAHWQSVQPEMDTSFISFYNDTGKFHTVEGVIIEPPDLRDTYTQLILQASQIQQEEAGPSIPVSGKLLTRVKPGETWRYGDKLRLTGKLTTPMENEEFSYQDYLARKGIYSHMVDAVPDLLLQDQGNPVRAGIYHLKERALTLIYQIYPDPEASLLAGILLGVEKGIPAPVRKAFDKTGTSHIIAISGFNMTIIAGLFAGSFGRILGPRKGALAAVVGISIYTVLVGANAAVVRSAIMGGLSIFARQVGRRQHGLNTLALTAAVMALFNPMILGDHGFQLSVAATLGLILYAQVFSEGFKSLMARWLSEATADRVTRPVGEYVLFTLAAQLVTLPVMAYHFNRISLVALIANPLILPAQPPVMILGGLAVLLGLVYYPLGQLAGYLALPFVTYTIHLVELFAGIPMGELRLGEVSLPVVVLFFILLFGWTFARSQMQARFTAWGAGLPLGVVGILAVLTWRSVLAIPDGRLHLALLDVSEGGKSGDAILITTPQGRHVLIDGGPYASLLSDALGRRLPLGERELDWLVVGGVAEAQLGALPRVIERFPPQNVLWAGPERGTRWATNLQDALISESIPITMAETGQVLDLGRGASLQVLQSGARGAVFLVEWGNFRAVLPVGIGLDDLKTLEYGKKIGQVSVLLLADNGYGPSNPPEWIENLSPEIVLLSVSGQDGGGMPSKETLVAVEGYTLLRTDQKGWIELSTDGERMWVEAAR
jgi:competence protein ComEC